MCNIIQGSNVMKIIGVLLLTLALAACGGGAPTSGTLPCDVTATCPVAAVTATPHSTAPERPVNTAPAAPPVDDYPAIQAALNAGGVVTLEPRVYHLSHGLIIPHSNTTLQGAGPATVLDVQPPQVGLSCDGEAAIITRCGVGATPMRQIVNAINVGDTSFQAASTADVANLNPGDFVFVAVYDNAIAYYIEQDYMQVASVSGTTVSVVKPFRQSFTNAYHFIPNAGGLGFCKVDTLTGIVIQNFTLKIEMSPIVNYPGVYILGSMGTLVQNLTVSDPMGNPIDAYLSQGTTFSHITVTAGRIISEMANDVDLVVEDCTFTSSAPAVGLDLGTAFFTVTRNHVISAWNAGIYALYNVNHGTINDNQIDMVLAEGGDETPVGIQLEGAEDVAVTGNTLLGGNGPYSTGIYSTPYNQGTLPEPGTGDTFTNNSIQGFVTLTNIQQ